MTTYVLTAAVSGIYLVWNKKTRKNMFPVYVVLLIAAVILVLIAFSKLVDRLFETHYSAAFHAVAGVVVAATVMIIPFDSFAVSVSGCIANVIALACGAGIAYLLSLIQVDQNA